jgi:hypothetical protein
MRRNSGRAGRYATLKIAASLLVATGVLIPEISRGDPVWAGYAGDAQHSAVSSVASDSLSTILWQTPVDLDPQYSGGNLFIHYGSPLVTQSDTIIVPVKTGASGGFKVQALNGATGASIWSQTTDYILPSPPGGWIPSYGPTLTPSNRLYFAGAGGTVYYRDSPDSAVPGATGQLAFYGMSTYGSNTAAHNTNVIIDTPITSDGAGNIYFGFLVNNPTQVNNLQGGIARIDANGIGTWKAAATLASGMTKVAMNSAPALSADGTKVYVVLNDGSNGKLVALDSTTLSLSASATLSGVIDQSSASPTVGPNGDVFIGTNNGYHGRGVMNHYSADLSQVKTPGSFGWDDTPSIVPASMVPSYHGTSSYLLMVKYNDYANYGLGGSGINKLAILDPGSAQTDPVTGQNVMKEILTIAGITPDPDFVANHPGAVREWCINTAVVDPATGSVLANSEDGRLYRWDLTTNSFSESITLTSGIGEAYTPTVIGASGQVFAINNATLFAIAPEPGTLALSVIGITFLCGMRRRG